MLCNLISSRGGLQISKDGIAFPTTMQPNIFKRYILIKTISGTATTKSMKCKLYRV